MDQIAEIPVKFVHNQVLAQVGIAGQKVLMQVDTGAQRSILFSAAVIELGLNPVDADGVSFRGVGGNQRARRVIVPLFEVGGATVKNQSFFVLSVKDGDSVGLLGADFFGKTETEFDLANGKIRMFVANNCGHNNLAYWSKEPAVADLVHGGDGTFESEDVLLNGRHVTTTFDSGAQISIVTITSARATGGVIGEVSGKVGGIGAGAVESRTAHFDTLALGDETIKNPVLKVGDFFNDKEDGVDFESNRRVNATAGAMQMLIGADFFRVHRILFSASQRRAYMTYTGTGGAIFQVVAPVGKPAPTPEPVEAAPK